MVTRKLDDSCFIFYCLFPSLSKKRPLKSKKSARVFIGLAVPIIYTLLWSEYNTCMLWNYQKSLGS